MSKSSKNRAIIVNTYMRKNYDRIEFIVPKGRKDEIKAIAVSVGVSTNKFIVDAIEHYSKTLIK